MKCIEHMLASLQEVLRSRSLIMTFALIDLRLRYRNSVLGFGWSVLEPLLILSILDFVFSHLLTTTVKNFPLFLILNLTIFNMFSRGTSLATESLLSRSGIIKSVFLRREIFPISSNITSFLMMIIEFSIVIIFMIAFQVMPSYTALMLPFYLFLLFVLTLGISFALASLNAYYRDVRAIWTVITQVLFFLSPIIYKISFLPSPASDLVRFSPLALIIEMSHNALLNSSLPTQMDLAYVTLTSFSTLIIGWLIFKKLNKRIAEVI